MTIREIPDTDIDHVLKFDSHSERGGGHADNEDHVLHETHPSGERRHLCFVADGQGGRADGAAASRAACKGALEAARSVDWREFSAPSTWDHIFTEANREVQNSCEGFTSLIGIAIDDTTLSGASVGDSRAYFQGDSDGLVELTEHQQKNPPIGGGCHRATAFHLPRYCGTLLVVTDGVWKYSGYDALRDAASIGDPGRIPRLLREAVVSAQGTGLPDDFTVLAATNREPVRGGD